MVSPSPALHLQIMGPLRVWRDGTEIDTGPRQQRCLLALLLARVGQPVTMTDLVALIWGPAAPPSAVNVVHKYIGVLRRLLEPSLPLRMPGTYLQRDAGGYRFTAGPEVLDLSAFRAEVTAARAGVIAAQADPGPVQTRHDAFRSGLGTTQGRHHTPQTGHDAIRSGHNAPRASLDPDQTRHHTPQTRHHARQIGHDAPQIGLNTDQDGHSAALGGLDTGQNRHDATGAAPGVDPDGVDDPLVRYANALRLCHGLSGGSLADSVGASAVFAAIDSEFCEAAIEAAGLAIRSRRPSSVLAPLRLAAELNPLNEAVYTELITALATAGQQAEALAVYQTIRGRLAEDLGIDPGQTLQDAHRKVLTQDGDTERRPAQSPPGRVSTQNGDTGVRPAQLPPDLPVFVGRTAELATLGALVDEARQEAPLIIALDGMGGVGKSTLAVHFAHRCADRFPDGQLYLDLQGDRADESLRAGDALRSLLYGLGIPYARIPGTFDTRVGAYRSLTAGRRILVLLDNVRDPAQVRPLLPNSAQSLVLLTSRRPLLGLAALEGAHLLRTELPDLATAQQLLRRRLPADRRHLPRAPGRLANAPGRLHGKPGHLSDGPGGQPGDRRRVPADPGRLAEGLGHLPDDRGDIDEIIELCGRLPLALAVLAARLTARPALSLDSVAADLRDGARRLGVFTAGSGTPDPRTAFSWSYRQLSSGAARLFRLLSVAFGAGVTAGACAGLSGDTPDRTRADLDELTEAALLDEHDDGRFTTHVLVKAYADELFHTIEGPDEHRAAVDRLLRYYLHSSLHAQAILSPSRPPIMPTPPAASTHPARTQTHEQTGNAHSERPQSPNRIADNRAVRPQGPEQIVGVHAERPQTYAQALAWFDGQREALAEAVRLADGPVAWRLAISMQQYLQVTGRFKDWEDVMRSALPATRESRDPVGEAHLLRSLAGARWSLGASEEALDLLSSALKIFEKQGMRQEQALTHTNIHRILETHPARLMTKPPA
ncbi:BTAD domain-containing putative transcriptional regulator [Actinoplanes derwentensis]|uniref:Transcriptional regulatory protein, C terminal n=1 Tax=Actinoplanes derwentensis TaxID=113562 RepID=A0A1H1YB96_9ACTN|nr:BTAD domain-containing putative transcriptional regulator [Actinoplanes derwentensis]GID90275.1 hypothetical protein Ade03nite_91990 [Actinoplanes derwentensis]SDT18730.1 Transcriptional regulatory protein, C terminal [Actinoplanes derwentensis]